jgi:hypothetical protein
MLHLHKLRSTAVKAHAPVPASFLECLWPALPLGPSAALPAPCPPAALAAAPAGSFLVRRVVVVSLCVAVTPTAAAAAAAVSIRSTCKAQVEQTSR